MRPIITFSVANTFPEQLARLNELCFNLYWVWNPVIREFLRSINPDLWHETNHHPLKVLQSVSLERLTALAADPGFVKRYRQALAELDTYRAAPGWYSGQERPEENAQEVIAYFSAEFGLHESVPLYSGGLGVLSGDHTKSASDLGLPFVCVGLMYQMGYFRQRLAMDGAQLEGYEFNDPSTLPITEVRGGDGTPLRITIDFPSGTVYIGVWRMDVGKVPVYLLDTNIRENGIPKYRDIADYLYGGDQETRIMQEIVLGIGGMRMLRTLGIRPTVTHCNEGHSAFLLLERARMLMEEMALTFTEAAELVFAGSIFTTHTPVPAGHDAFPAEMVDRYFATYWPTLGLSRGEFYALGRVETTNEQEPFSMTVLALKMASKRNGVSKLHGVVSQEMWGKLWPGFAKNEIPIIGITNGVHTQTWVADTIRDLFDKHLGKNWHTTIADADMWHGVDTIPDNELWEVKNGLRSSMLGYIRHRLLERETELYTRTETGRDVSSILDPTALTIGFARRFATYKRATILFRDKDRAYRLFTDPDRPLQLVIAGKAHPKDSAGKQFIREIFAFVRETGLEKRIVFVEDYDMAVARHMVQGCDVWLNTPRRPMEASGTSGMKAAINGTLNVSILDGWYPEGYNGTNGFAIGTERTFTDHDHQDEVESRQLYRTLEEGVLPIFYDRNKQGIPEQWVAMQKQALCDMVPMFSSDRMVAEYATRFYFPASTRFQNMSSNNGIRARDLVSWKRRIQERWHTVQFTGVTAQEGQHMKLWEEMNVQASLLLGELSPNEVAVEAFDGPLNPDNEIVEGRATTLAFEGYDNGRAVFSGAVKFGEVGRRGLTVRVTPIHPHLNNGCDLNLVQWATP